MTQNESVRASRAKLSRIDPEDLFAAHQDIITGGTTPRMLDRPGPISQQPMSGHPASSGQITVLFCAVFIVQRPQEELARVLQCELCNKWLPAYIKCFYRADTRLYGRAVTSVTVTPAGHRDMDSFAASVVGLFREDAGEHDPSMDIDWPVRDGRAYYSGLLSEESCLLAVARDADLVVGHLMGKLLAPDSLRLHRFAVLESMRVDPSLRGRGIGGMLIKYFLHWAGERGAQQASVTAFAANERAQRLYRRHGFAPSAVTMRRAV